MKKQITLSVFILFIGIFSLQAQCKQDSLFLKQMISNPKLIESKSYFFETERQHSDPQFGKSGLIKAKDTPTFNSRGELTNGIPYATFGNKPITFKGTKTDKVEINNEKLLCLVLSFTCDGEQYKTYEVGYAEPRGRNYYKLIEADFLKEAQKQLIGKTLYTKTAKWEQYNENEMNSNRKLSKIEDGESACKYCPVVITRIDNDYDDKYIVLFKKGNQGKEYCFGNVTFNYAEINSFLNFTRYFTFENPQTKHPTISQERWDEIMNQKIKKGFTPEEVKIAYGKPDDVVTEDDDETWIYYNYCRKDYAITFKNGIVDKVVSQSVR